MAKAKSIFLENSGKIYPITVGSVIRSTHTNREKALAIAEGLRGDVIVYEQILDDEPNHQGWGASSATIIFEKGAWQVPGDRRSSSSEGHQIIWSLSPSTEELNESANGFRQLRVYIEEAQYDHDEEEDFEAPQVTNWKRSPPRERFERLNVRARSPPTIFNNNSLNNLTLVKSGL